MPRRPAKRAVRTTAPQISASEFKATCLVLMDQVARSGATVIVTKHGRPVVQVSPVAGTSASPLGFLAGTIVCHGDIVSSDDQSWLTSPTDPLGLRTRRS